MFVQYVPIWKKAPFIRFLVPLMIGIVLQWQIQLSVKVICSVFLVALLILLTGFFWNDFQRLQFAAIKGFCISILFLAVGSLLTLFKDIRHDINWFGKNYETTDCVKIILQEPLVEKNNSQKAIAAVALKRGNKIIPCKGYIIVYLPKDSLPSLDYGSQIIFAKPLLEIKNEGNPGGFDYKRFCLFQDITHQVFLKKGEFIVLDKKNPSLFDKVLFPLRKKILSILRHNIRGEKECGLAEALLIGYKDDLDKSLVQSYTNTGVVHIIAISGMHIALIYWLLDLLCQPLKKLKYSKWFVTLIIISGLWLFSLLAGAQASVLRSAVMFTCIVLGKNFSRSSSIYNTLAVSAFILLCYDPFWLWDVGFQLSYAAVLSIVIFVRPVYNWFYIKNKILDFIWKLNAVSIAAQMLTTPFSIYHFHQFPILFLLSNFAVVPLSSIIVLGEIFLCSTFFFPFAASLSGKILSQLIWIMNSYIERIEALPYSLWQGLEVNIAQATFLIVMTIGFAYFFLEKQKGGVWVGLFSLLCFMTLRSLSFSHCTRQQKIIVYNIPKHKAIDLIAGRSYLFIGDSDLVASKFLQNFYLKSSRILYRTDSADHLKQVIYHENFIEFNSRKILLINKNLSFDTISKKIPIDLLIISNNPRLNLPRLSRTFSIKQIVFDGSAKAKKITYWIKDCHSLHIPFHNTSEKGAFVMNLN
jgi:competence protein ComEC